MINQKIVLVLGAGASMPFGLPSGAALKTEITKTLVPRNKRHIELEDAGFTIGQIRDFRMALQKSGKNSVHAFLEHRTEFVEVGKAATAGALLPREVEDALSPNNETWYGYFFNRLNTKFDEFARNSVSILTFNYDRSLEHYLFTALQNAYGKTSRECAEVLQSIPIVHLYGLLGELPPLSKDAIGIPYGSPVDAQTLKRAASGIKIIHEVQTDQKLFNEAHELLRNATRICFLGFGYSVTNMERLLGYGPGHPPEVFGSALGFTESECMLLRNQFLRLGFGRIACLDRHWEALQFLRER